MRAITVQRVSLWPPRLLHEHLPLPCCPLASPAGPAAWRAVTLAWAAKLEEQHGEPSLAALHLLAAGEVEAAVQVKKAGHGCWARGQVGEPGWAGRCGAASRLPCWALPAPACGRGTPACRAPPPQVYRRAGLLREAAALASARLLPGHPLLQVRCSGLEWAGPRAVR